jgi:polyphosphate glucokinase
MHEGERLLSIGVDVGGTGIKAAIVDVKTGELAGERIRVPTPMPAKPGPVVASAGRVVARLIRAANAAATAAGQPAPKIQAIGVGFPSVILNGVTKTAANVDPEWVGFQAEAAFTKAFKRRAWLVNDADAAGVAEMRFGAGYGKRGVVIVLTLGTGVGSGIFVDGRLVPNTELGHMEANGKDAERRSSANARVRRGLSWKAWAEDLDDHLKAIDVLFSPSLLILGGGVSKKADRFVPFLKAPGQIVGAQLRNEAGIVGAAIVGLERETEMAREERDVAAERSRGEPQPNPPAASTATGAG